MKPPHPTPAPGQVWRPCDPRHRDRLLLILAIEEDPRRFGPRGPVARVVTVGRDSRGWFRAAGRPTSWIRIDRFRGSARTGYALVAEGVEIE